MASFVDEQFDGKPQELDGNEYEKCTFKNCSMVYKGGTLPKISQCHFEDCSWDFQDAADRTLTMLRSVYHGMGDGGKQMIDATFEQIRRA